MMFIDSLWRCCGQRLVIVLVQVIFVQLPAVDKDHAIAKLDDLARQADNALYVALVRIVRKPEHHDVAAFDVSPTNALYPVINQFVHQQPLAVVKLRQHGRSLDHNWLNEKYAEEDENDNDQKNVA